jgi:ADP-ribose pyrophosphatase YjhB (NUDIX family)
MLKLWTQEISGKASLSLRVYNLSMVENSISAGGVVVNSRGQVALTFQDGVVWSLPKGRLEQGEDGLAAARREIEEETGIAQLELLKTLGTYSRYKIGKDGRGDDKSVKKTITIYLFRTNQEELKPTDPAHSEARWVEPDKVADLLSNQADKEFFNRVAPEVKLSIKNN